MTRFRIREGYDFLEGKPVTRIELGDDKNLKMFELRDSLKNIPIRTFAVMLEQLTDEWTKSKSLFSDTLNLLVEENARLRAKAVELEKSLETITVYLRKT